MVLHTRTQKGLEETSSASDSSTDKICYLQLTFCVPLCNLCVLLSDSDGVLVLFDPFEECDYLVSLISSVVKSREDMSVIIFNNNNLFLFQTISF